MPTVRYLKSTFDTLDVDYNIADVALKQQILQKGLERDYFKILKRARKQSINFKKFDYTGVTYTYGVNDQGHEFCYVVMKAKKGRKDMTIGFLALKLNGKWFIGDELYIYWI